MLLRNSISNTKKFFQKTIDNVKSFLSVGSTYQKLPKTPPFHFSCGRDTNKIDGDYKYNNTNELDYFYTEFTNQWDSHKRKSKNKAPKKSIHATIPTTQYNPTKVELEESRIRASKKKSQQLFLDDSSQKENCHIYHAGIEENIKTPEKNSDFDKRGYISNEKNIENKDVLKSKKSNLSPGKIMKKTDLSSKSVREKRLGFVAEKLKELEVIDKGNVDHKLDFEEFLHYYSRLTCPAYLDIVDKFLMEMCREFFGPQASPKVNYSRPVLQALKV